MAGEIGREYDARSDEEKPTDDLIKLVEEIVPFNMQHNAEHEAADLLIEVDLIEKVRTICKWVIFLDIF